MRPTQFSETVAVAPLPAYDQFSVESKFTLECTKRHKAGVGLLHVQVPCNFAKAIICNRPVTTSKRFISRLELTPKLRPRSFNQTMYVLPKHPENMYTSMVQHHVEGRRKWYTSRIDMGPTIDCKLTTSRQEIDIDDSIGKVYRSEWKPMSNGHIVNGDVRNGISHRLVNGHNAGGRSYRPNGPFGYFDHGEESDEISI